MKNTLFPFLLIFCFIFNAQVQSQSIQLSLNLDTIYTTTAQSETFTTVTVKNISSSIINVRVDRISEVLSTGHEIYFCWDQCYPPGTTSSGGAIEINPGDSILSFTAHILPNGNEGSSEAVFLFSNEEATDDTSSVKLVYEVDKASDINEITQGIFHLLSISKINNNLTIQLSDQLPQLEIAIYSSSGQIVLQNTFHQIQNLMLPINNLSNGLYFIQLNTPTHAFRQKLIIVN